MVWQSAFVAALLSLAGHVGGKVHARLAAVESRVETAKLATPDPKSTLRIELEQELVKIDWTAEKVNRPFELVAVLSDAESSTGKNGAHASCTIQLLMREPGGALLGRVTGRASGEDREGSRLSLEAGVFEAASRSAASALPEALRRSRKAR
jgi:hypothetical protein